MPKNRHFLGLVKKHKINNIQELIQQKLALEIAKKSAIRNALKDISGV